MYYSDWVDMVTFEFERKNRPHRKSLCYAMACPPMVETIMDSGCFQFQTVILALGESFGVQCHVCATGTSPEIDVMKLKAKPCHIVVGTPARIYELIKIREVLGETYLSETSIRL